MDDSQIDYFSEVLPEIKSGSPVYQSSDDQDPSSDAIADDPVVLTDNPADDPVFLFQNPEDDLFLFFESLADHPVPLSDNPADDPVTSFDNPEDDPVPLSDSPEDDPVPLSDSPEDDPVPLSDNPEDDHIFSDSPEDDPVPLSVQPADIPFSFFDNPEDNPFLFFAHFLDRPVPPLTNQQMALSPLSDQPADGPVPLSESPADAPVPFSESPADDPVPFSESPADDSVPFPDQPADDPAPLSDNVEDDPVSLSDQPAYDPVPLSDSPEDGPAPLSDIPAEDHAPLSYTLEDDCVSVSHISMDSFSDTLAQDLDLPPTLAEGTSTGRHYLRLVLVHLCLGLLGGFIAVAILCKYASILFQQATKPVQSKYDDLQKYNRQIEEEIKDTENNSTSFQSKLQDLQHSITLIEETVTYYKKYLKELQICRGNLSVAWAALEEFRVNGSCEVCSSGWEYFRGKCFFFSEDTMSWPESRDSCTTKGAKLVKIETAVEQAFLAKQVAQRMANNEDRFWIGLTDAETEGHWIWMDNTALDEDSSFWSAAEPDDWKGQRGEHVQGEDCANTGGSPCQTTCWRDSVCEKTLRQICETFSI